MPGVDREGAIFSSFQTQIQQNILQLHKAIVEESHRANSPSINPWMNNLRMLINECVSIVDITLHQLYIAAEYGLKSGTPLNWKFDPEKLGQRHGLRIKDKLHWVTLITGNVLGDAEKEVSAFNELREVRNHLSHFDPPCVALTVEDVMHWLNLVSSLGKLLWKIRDKLNAQLTPELVEIILLPTVELCPVYPHLPRPKQPANSGYGSTRWPTTTKPYKSHSIRTVERVLSNAVEVLATATGTIQERLYRAADFLFRLQEQELPNSLKANYFELRTKLIAPNDKGGNSLRVNTLSKSDDEASIYAGKIFAMQKELLLSYSLSIKRA